MIVGEEHPKAKSKMKYGFSKLRPVEQMITCSVKQKIIYKLHEKPHALWFKGIYSVRCNVITESNVLEQVWHFKI